MGVSLGLGLNLGQIALPFPPPPPPPPAMYTPSMPLMPSMYVPSTTQMRGVWGFEHEQVQETRRESEGEGYDPFRSHRQGEKGEMVDDGNGDEESGEGRESSIDIDQQELYDPLNPMMDQGEHASKPYDVDRYRVVSLGVAVEGEVEKEDEISWGEEGDGGADEVDEVAASSGGENQPMEIDAEGSEHGHGAMDVEERHHVLGPGLGSQETQVEHQTENQDQDEVEGSEPFSKEPLEEGVTEDGNHAQSKEDETDNGKEIESLTDNESGFRSQGNEIDEESGDKSQRSHVSYVLVVETEEDRGELIETVQEELDILEGCEAEGDARSKHHAMEIDYESDGQNQDSDAPGGDKDEDEDRPAETAGDETGAKDKVVSGVEPGTQARSSEMEIDYECEDQDQDSNVSSDEQRKDEVQGVDPTDNQNDVEDEVGSVIEIQNEAECEADPELAAQEMEIDYESKDQDEHSIISSDREEVGYVRYEATGDSPIGYQSDGEDEDSNISDKMTEQQKDLVQEEHGPAHRPQDTSPTNPTSEQFWSQLEILDRERITSLSSKTSKHVDNFSQRKQSLESHASHAATHLETRAQNLATGGNELLIHSQAQEEHLERLPNQAYTPAPFVRSPAPELASPTIDADGFLLPSPPIRSSNTFVGLNYAVLEPRVNPDNALDSMNQMDHQANEHVEQVSQLSQPQSIGLESINQQFSRMNEVLGTINDFAARMQETREDINARAAVVAQLVEEIEENRVWGEMRRLREVALGRLAQKDKENGKGKGLVKNDGGSWAEDLRMVLGRGVVYSLKRVLVDGVGYATEDVVDVEVEVEAPVPNDEGKTMEGGEVEEKPQPQADGAKAETIVSDDPEDADELTQKMDELFGGSDDMEEDNPGFWDGSSDAMNEALHPDVQEMEDEYAAMQEERGMNDGEEDEDEEDEEDDDSLDSEYIS